jgi:hypothetical protein
MALFVSPAGWVVAAIFVVLQWLAREDGLIAIPPKPARALPLFLTQQDQGTIIFITIVLMPSLIVSAGVMVWWRRRLLR